MLERKGVEDDGTILAIATTVGKNVAEAIIEENNRKAEKKIADNFLEAQRQINEGRAALREYASLFQDLINNLQLMPHEVIVSVAIREADGEIRVVNV